MANRARRRMDCKGPYCQAEGTNITPYRGKSGGLCPGCIAGFCLGALGAAFTQTTGPNETRFHRYYQCEEDGPIYPIRYFRAGTGQGSRMLPEIPIEVIAFSLGRFYVTDAARLALVLGRYENALTNQRESAARRARGELHVALCPYTVDGHALCARGDECSSSPSPAWIGVAGFWCMGCILGQLGRRLLQRGSTWVRALVTEDGFVGMAVRTRSGNWTLPLECVRCAMPHLLPGSDRYESRIARAQYQVNRNAQLAEMRSALRLTRISMSPQARATTEELDGTLPIIEEFRAVLNLESDNIFYVGKGRQQGDVFASYEHFRFLIATQGNPWLLVRLPNGQGRRLRASDFTRGFLRRTFRITMIGGLIEQKALDTEDFVQGRLENEPGRLFYVVGAGERVGWREGVFGCIIICFPGYVGRVRRCAVGDLAFSANMPRDAQDRMRAHFDLDERHFVPLVASAVVEDDDDDEDDDDEDDGAYMDEFERLESNVMARANAEEPAPVEEAVVVEEPAPVEEDVAVNERELAPEDANERELAPEDANERELAPEDANEPAPVEENVAVVDEAAPGVAVEEPPHANEAEAVAVDEPERPRRRRRVQATLDSFFRR